MGRLCSGLPSPVGDVQSYPKSRLSPSPLPDLPLHSGLKDEVPKGRGQSSQGAFPQGIKTRPLGVGIRYIHSPPRGVLCTRVYTLVYPRVHYCIHACTLSRSKYVLCRALVGMSIPQLMCWEWSLCRGITLGHAVIAPKGSRVDHTAGEYTATPDYYFSYAVAQLKKKKNNFVQDREIGISTGLPLGIA